MPGNARRRRLLRWRRRFSNTRLQGFQLRTSRNALSERHGANIAQTAILDLLSSNSEQQRNRLPNTMNECELPTYLPNII